MYLGMLSASTGSGVAVAAVSFLGFGHPWWLALAFWSLTGTIMMLAWILYGVTHPDRFDTLTSLADCDDEPGVAEADRDRHREPA